MRHQRFITKVFIAVAIGITFGALSSTAWAIAVKGKSISTDGRLETLRKTDEDAVVPLALSIAPAIVVGGNQTTATITVSTAAPAGGIEITLRSPNAEVARFGGTFAAIGASQLRIPEGSVSATFPVHTFGVVSRTTVTLQALSGSESASATVTVNPASARTLAITPGRVVGGVNATGTVTLDGVAPASGGVTVRLSAVRQASNRTSPADTSPAASVPAAVSVPPGASSATFVVTTNPVLTDTVVNLRAATLGESSGVSNISDGTSNTIVFGEPAARAPTAVLTISPAVVDQLSLNPQSVPGGASSTGTVVLTGKAPVGGLTLGLSEGSSDASTPSSINVAAGADRKDFQIMTRAVDSPRIVAINVFPPNVQPIVPGGSISLVGSGSSSGGPTSSPITANLSITPSLAVTAQPSPATAGAPVAITLMVQPDPAGSAPVVLTTDHPEILQVPPAVAVPPQTSLQRIIVNAPTNATSTDQSVTITASRGSLSASTTLLIKQTPPPISSFTLRPTTVTGGSNIISQITLSITAPSSVVVSLTTDHPELVTVPATVTIARSATFTPLTFKTLPTTAQTTVTITASTGSQTTSATVNVVPVP
ncbi:MAG: hypothetical protein M3Y84_10260 [Acidobacteriota bacterium]|nr:hypothetical protein [Acidobacteriota bacterium]